MMDNLDVLVIFTDNTNSVFSIEPKTTVKLFKEIVAQTIDLKDDIYFGFCIKDDRDVNYWLSDNKSVISHDYFKGMLSNIKLHFVIKYFYEIQSVLTDNVVKYYLYHQLKCGLYSGDIECDSDLCFELLAMTVCIDEIRFENFCEQTKKTSIIPLHLFSKHPSIEHCILKIEEKYRDLVGQNYDILMEKFINLIFQMPTEITHFFISKDSNSSPVVFGINKNGFIECNSNSKSSYKLTYQWADIITINCNKSRIIVDIQDPYHKSSLRRKSCANCVYYDVINANLAKSIVCLAKDTIDFISNYRYLPASTLKSGQYKSERRNMSYIKKFNSSTASRKGEKCRTPVSNLFTSESSVELSRSPSRISISSSNFNGSCLTNDSASLQYDDDSLTSHMTLQELKHKFTELYTRKNELQNSINQKIAKAKELSKEEFTMTCKIPLDHKLFDPMGEICFTNNPLPSRLLNPENQSDYQNKKNELLMQIETLSNIYEVLRKRRRSENKIKKELEDKKKEIDVIRNKLAALEMEHAAELGNCRSNSMGNLNRISSGLTEKKPNGYLSNNENIRFNVKPCYKTPLTEPSQRKFKPSDKLKIPSSDWNDETHQRIANDFNCSSPSNSHIISEKPYNMNGIQFDSIAVNRSNFQRFHSARSIVKGPASLEKLKESISKTENEDVDPIDSSISSTSRSSIDDVTTSEISERQDPPICHRENEENINRTTDSRTSNIRDSMEINQTRLIHIETRYCQRIISKSNKHNRKSTSLEDLREEESNAPIKYLARREQNVHSEPLYSSKTRITYHPSIKCARPGNITRGKQPSITKKEARNNSLDMT